MASRILLLKTEKLSNFVRQGSKSFHLVMVNGKKSVFEKVVFCVYIWLINQFVLLHLQVLIGPHMFLSPRYKRDVTCLENL